MRLIITQRARAQYDNNSSYLIWGDLVFDYGEASGETNTNKSYAHIRLIHTFLDIKELNYEAFFQSETNEFTKVESKFLGGGGLRLHENMKKYGNLYFGLGCFFETIEYTTTVDKHENNLRMNSYASYTKTFNKTSKLSYVLYYQPNVENFSDYILSSGLELQVVLYKELYLSFVFYYDVDGEPAVGVEESDVTQKTSLIYKF